MTFLYMNPQIVYTACTFWYKIKKGFFFFIPPVEEKGSLTSYKFIYMEHMTCSFYSMLISFSHEALKCIKISFHKQSDTDTL